VESVIDQPRSGRPRSAPVVDAERIQEVLEKSPLELGYRYNVWTVPLLTRHFRESEGVELNQTTAESDTSCFECRSPGNSNVR
jgi:hypothetical protein